MAGAGEFTATSSAAILGLRERILDNAVILYPTIIKDYGDVSGVAKNTVKPAEIFKIITIEHSWVQVYPYKSFTGVKAVLLYSRTACAAPTQVIEGPMAVNRDDALEALLKATERCLGCGQLEITKPLIGDQSEVEVPAAVPDDGIYAFMNNTLLD